MNRMLLYLILSSMLHLDSSVYAQIRTWHSQERLNLPQFGIDPDNTQQVLDSLRSRNILARHSVIRFCGQETLRTAVPLLRDLFASDSARKDRSSILFAIRRMGDTTFQNEFRTEIDSLRGTDERITDITFFTSYLMEKHNDDYGFTAILPYYADPEKLNRHKPLIGELEPFFGSPHEAEVRTILRNCASSHPTGGARGVCLRYLQRLQDPQLEPLAYQRAFSDSDGTVRLIAREILKEISSPRYVETLYDAVQHETHFRSSYYASLLSTRQPSAYKYVVDVYRENRDPESNSLLKLELENPFVFLLPRNVSTTTAFDSLIFAVNQLADYEWLADAAFVDELTNDLQTARNYLASGDTANAASSTKAFRRTVDEEYRDSLDGDNRSVTIEAWRFLYFSSSLMLERLLSSDQLDTVVAVHPNSVHADSPNITLSIHGRGFAHGTEAFWNGDPRVTSVLSDTALQMIVLPSDLLIPGTAEIRVINPVRTAGGTLLFSILPASSPTYTLTLSVVGNGTVTKSPDLAAYDSASTVQLTATPAAGYTFAGWSGDVSGTSNPLTMVMNSSKEITAIFAPSSLITTYSLFATHSMHLEQNSKVFSGDIGVNDAGSPPFLDSQVELSIGIGVTTAAGSSVKAHRIKVKSGATVHGSIHYNTIENNGTITGTQHTPLPLPLVATLPEFKSATPGTQNIEVPQNGTHTLQPDSYGDIMVRRNGRLILTGGTYHLSSFTGGDNVQLICQAPAEIRIAGKFDSGQGSFIGPEDTTLVSADKIMFHVGGINGTNGTLGATPKAAKIGIGNRVWASFYVPNGTLWIRQNSEATGQFIGKDVDVGIGVKVRKIMTMKNDE
jgi:uncharacterized repeat protein (TIGR02543 family)